MQKLRLGFFASGRGSNMQAIIDACLAGRLNAEPCVVISNNRGAEALERARASGIPAFHLSGKTHPDVDDLDRVVLAALQGQQVEVVALAGYMRKLGPQTLKAFDGRVLNIHPALLPKFGGKGMYGMHVHEAVIRAGEQESGVTIHVADGEYDTGPILAQRRVPVLPGDTPESLAARVLVHEHEFYVETLIRIAEGEIALAGLRRVS